jgi:hypothetical protein
VQPPIGDLVIGGAGDGELPRTAAPRLTEPQISEVRAVAGSALQQRARPVEQQDVSMMPIAVAVPSQPLQRMPADLSQSMDRQTKGIINMHNIRTYVRDSHALFHTILSESNNVGSFVGQIEQLTSTIMKTNAQTLAPTPVPDPNLDINSQAAALAGFHMSQFRHGFGNMPYWSACALAEIVQVARQLQDELPPLYERGFRRVCNILNIPVNEEKRAVLAKLIDQLKVPITVKRAAESKQGTTTAQKKRKSPVISPPPADIKVNHPPPTSEEVAAIVAETEKPAKRVKQNTPPTAAVAESSVDAPTHETAAKLALIKQQANRQAKTMLQTTTTSAAQATSPKYKRPAKAKAKVMLEEKKTEKKPVVEAVQQTTVPVAKSVVATQAVGPMTIVKPQKAPASVAKEAAVAVSTANSEKTLKSQNAPATALVVDSDKKTLKPQQKAISSAVVPKETADTPQKPLSAESVRQAKEISARYSDSVQQMEQLRLKKEQLLKLNRSKASRVSLNG